jgi:hypothetical protein
MPFAQRLRLGCPFGLEVKSFGVESPSPIPNSFHETGFFTLTEKLFLLLFPRHEQVGQEHSDGRDIGDQHKGDEHGDIERNTSS